MSAGEFLADDLPEVVSLRRQQRAERMEAKAEASSWTAVDLSGIVRGENLDPPPSVLRRSDGHHLFYAGRCHVVHGPTESLKSWLVQVACAQEMAAGNHVLYFDFEDSASGVTNRLLALGASADLIVERFRYIRPIEPLDHPGRTALDALLELDPTLAVVDGVTEAMMLHGLNPRDEVQVAQFQAMLAKRIASWGPAVASIDHEGNASDGGRPIGSQHKRAGIDGASYGMKVTTPAGRGRHGVAVISITKDRTGRVREHHPKLAGELHLWSQASGRVTAEVLPPRAEGEPTVFRPDVLMERVSRFLEGMPGGRSKNVVTGSVSGKTDAKRLAIDLLIEEGYIELDKSGQAHLLKSVRPFRRGEVERPSLPG